MIKCLQLKDPQFKSFGDVEKKLFHASEVLYQNRYCDQKEFNVLVCGLDPNRVLQLNGSELQPSDSFDPFYFPRCSIEAAVVNSNLLVYGGSLKYAGSA